ncbi:dihydroneopterin aldolase [Alicyclobacillus macrosporangiidus]|uniref:7,8-dihydroneopterin aldolase n=1 Tax=Alicyclobacillus macrosporangiidus TaxID=392015 RepID=A0A1I7FII8_9BACL|nr:dihydroneopterin aldolase [Alicyclobacillus macrosporangiidus]SFU35984.1 dihydroneopterin aldolase [Alicyclobacillus macrosporangiidus]
MDSILLRNMTFYGYHGAFPEEKAMGQRFVVSLELYLDLGPAGASDQLGDTVNYAAVYEDVRQVMEGPAYNLLERVAQRIAEEVLARHPRLQGIRVEIEKPSVPIPGAIEAVRVAMERWRPGGSAGQRTRR